MQEKPTSQSQTGTIVWIVISQLISLSSLLLWLLTVLGMTTLLYGVNIDTNPGEAATDLFSPLMTTLVWFYPLLPIAILIGTVLLFRRKKTGMALAVTTIPVLLFGCAGCYLLWYLLFT